MYGIQATSNLLLKSLSFLIESDKEESFYLSVTPEETYVIKA